MARFQYSRRGLNFRQHILQRIFEILPGLTSWSILIGIVWLAFKSSLLAAVVMIAFYLYWLMRIFYMTIFLVIAYVRLAMEQKTNWMERIRDVSEKPGDLNKWRKSASKFKFVQMISVWVHEKNLETLEEAGSKPPALDDIYHLIILPVARERRDIIEPGVKSFISSQFPAKRMVMAIALEERSTSAVKADVEELRKKYKHHFHDFLVVVHPNGLPGEARVKGANATFTAKAAKKHFETHGIEIKNVIVSCFDADTIVGPDYFACLTYHFMITPDRDRASFQPIPVYNNNIWTVKALTRVLEIGSSFFQLIEATNPEQLVTFSSHSMSFKALVDAGYWPCDIISDDSAIFWKALIHFKGDYRVIPMYVTLSMDVVDAGVWWKTIIGVYKQRRRWAWGVENFAPVMRGFLKDKQIPLARKFRLGFKLFAMNISWATWGFLLTVIGWLPALFAGREFSSSVLYYSTPRIAGIIFNLASLTLLVTFLVALFLLPKKKMVHPIWERFLLALEWLLVPLIISFLGTLPALDAQTRLLFGRYMEFWVSDKKRPVEPAETE